VEHRSTRDSDRSTWNKDLQPRAILAANESMNKAIRGIIVLLVIVLGLGTFCTVGTRTYRGCTECGVRRKDLTVLGYSMPTDTPTARSGWYDRRIGTTHDHHWTNLSCTRGFNLWGRTARWVCGSRGDYPGEDAALGAILTRLEPLGLDLPYHYELTHVDADRRRTAAAAAQNFDPTSKNEAVWRWWEEAGWPWPARRQVLPTW